MVQNFLKRLLGSEGGRLPADDARTAIAVVLVMAARADDNYEPRERDVIDRILVQRYGLPQAEAAALRGRAEAIETEAVDLFHFTRAIKQAVPLDERFSIVEALWRVVLVDAHKDPSEEALLRQLVELLGLSPMDSARARRAASI